MHDLASPSAVGARTEAAVASALTRAGFDVYLPAFGAHGRVDLVYGDDRRLVRVQCKSARQVGSVLLFLTSSRTGHVPRSYEGQIDLFGVYAAATGLVYLVPIEHVPTREGSLRLGPTRNGQASGIRWARDYELGPP